MADVVTRQELAVVIGEKTMHIQNRDELVRSIAAYVMTADKPVDINSLTRDIMQYRLEKGYIEAVAVSAHELSSRVRDDIIALLNERYPHAVQVRVDSVIDENVVGGVRIELPHEVLDLSVRSKLNLFKRLVAEEGAR